MTLISAYQHQDQNILEKVFPIVKHKQFKKFSSPEVQSKMLDLTGKSIVCRIPVSNKSPEESNICAIYTSDTPEKEINQAWSFGYVEGAWRFAGSTSEIRNWIPQAKTAEALTRKILEKEQAEKDR